MTHIAALDLGTNTVLLTVAKWQETGVFEPILELSTIARLGEGVDESGELSPQAEQRTLAVLARYAQVCRDHGVERVAAIGTSALRDARGGKSFVERASAVLGCALEVASGTREAELTYRGAALGLALTGGPERFVFDVGGGSTEFILGRDERQLEHAFSLDVGSVRLFERHGRAHMGSEKAFAAVEASVARLLEELPAEMFSRANDVIGVAGTVASLFSIAHLSGVASPGAAHGGRLHLSEVRKVCSELLRMSAEERQHIPCLGVGRADVIVYGAAVVSQTLAFVGRHQELADPHLIVSERGVRYGCLRELSEALLLERSASPRAKR